MDLELRALEGYPMIANAAASCRAAIRSRDDLDDTERNVNHCERRDIEAHERVLSEKARLVASITLIYRALLATARVLADVAHRHLVLPLCDTNDDLSILALSSYAPSNPRVQNVDDPALCAGCRGRNSRPSYGSSANAR